MFRVRLAARLGFERKGSVGETRVREFRKEAKSRGEGNLSRINRLEHLPT